MNGFENQIKALGLPLPKPREKQINYIKRVLLSGISLNTRMCRFVGIGNFHSVISEMKKQKIEFYRDKKQAYCSFREVVPPEPVLHVWMSSQQINMYWGTRK